MLFRLVCFVTCYTRVVCAWTHKPCEILARLVVDVHFVFDRCVQVVSPIIAERMRYIAVPPVRYIDATHDVLIDEVRACFVLFACCCLADPVKQLVLFAPELPPSAVEVCFSL